MSNVNNFLDVMNKNSYIHNILVPILDGFKLIPSDNSILFVAMSDNKYMQQYLCEGVISNEESFDMHIMKVIEKAKDAMKKENFENVDNCFTFYKDYNNGIFNFKVYLQDYIRDGKVLRQYNVYFLDSNSNAFFNVSLTTCPYGISDMESISDDITNSLDVSMTNLMDKIKYRKK